MQLGNDNIIPADPPVGRKFCSLATPSHFPLLITGWKEVGASKRIWGLLLLAIEAIYHGTNSNCLMDDLEQGCFVKGILWLLQVPTATLNLKKKQVSQQKVQINATITYSPFIVSFPFTSVEDVVPVEQSRCGSEYRIPCSWFRCARGHGA